MASLTRLHLLLRFPKITHGCAPTTRKYIKIILSCKRKWKPVKHVALSEFTENVVIKSNA